MDGILYRFSLQPEDFQKTLQEMGSGQDSTDLGQISNEQSPKIILRLDTYLVQKISSTRSSILSLIKKGRVFCNKKAILKAGYRLKIGDCIEIYDGTLDWTHHKGWSSGVKNLNQDNLEDGEDLEIQILYEDEEILVLNKPYNLVVHQAFSHHKFTLVDWLKKRGFVLSNLAGEERCGIVHRLDKDTTGAILIAKNNQSHLNLSGQLKSRDMGRYYLAIIENGISEARVVENYLGRHPNNRIKMTPLDPKKPNARYAKTCFVPLLDSLDSLSHSKRLQIIAAKLFTGRTHQIRVHLECICRHIVCDPIYGTSFGVSLSSYGEKNKSSCRKLKSHEVELPLGYGMLSEEQKDVWIPSRIMLHAYEIHFTHPVTNQKLSFKAPIFNDMLEYMYRNFPKEHLDEILDKNPDVFFHS